MVRQWKFHITPGVPCLDFANTVSWRRSPHPIDRLETYRDLVSWARQARLIARGTEPSLRQAVGDREAVSFLQQARRLREAIFEVFSAIAEGRKPAKRSMAALQRYLDEALRHSSLTATEQGFGWQVKKDQRGIARVLFEVALSAEALLRSQGSQRVGECSGRDCRWLWLDRTKNKSRRWCDMSVCGNREKARRHYERHAVSLP
jgi:predicted RNA-binding Zn ribbon-like protein